LIPSRLFLYSLPLLAAGVRALSLPGWSWAGFIFFAPVLRMLYWEKGGTWKGDLVGGLAFFSLAFRFLGQVAPELPWAPPLGVGFYLGGWWVLEGWLYRRLRRRRSLFVAAFFALLAVEFFRTIAPMGGVPWGSYSLGLSHWWLVQNTADVLGERGWVLVVLYFGCLLGLIPLKAFASGLGNRFLALGLIFLAIVFGFPRGAPMKSGDSLWTVAVQANIGVDEKHARELEGGGPPSAMEIYERQVEWTARALAAHPSAELVLWAETMFPFPMVPLDAEGVMRRPWPGSPDEVVPVEHLHHFQTEVAREVFAGQATSPPWLVVGCHFYQGVSEESGVWSPRTSEVVAFDPSGQMTAHAAKMELVPFGEQLPLGGAFPGADALSLSAFGSFGLLPDFDQPNRPGPLRVHGHDLGVAVCWENVFEGVFRRQAKRGAEAFLVLSNENWYGLSEEMDQMVAATQYRALETGRFVIRGTNTGQTVLVSPTGKLLESIERGKAGFLAVSLPMIVAQHSTPYLQWGWLLLPLLAAIGLLWALLDPVFYRK